MTENNIDPAAVREELFRLRLEKTAFFVGAFSIPCTLFSPFIVPCFLGSLAIIFAVISKGGNLKFSGRGRMAFFLGILAIVINVLYLGIAMRTIRELLADPAGRQKVSDLIYQQYGMTLDELLSLLPSLQ